MFAFLRPHSPSPSEPENRLLVASSSNTSLNHPLLALLIPHVVEGRDRYHSCYYNISLNDSTITACNGDNIPRLLTTSKDFEAMGTDAGHIKQWQQGTDFLTVFRHWSSTQCNAHPLFMLVEDDVSPCAGFTPYLSMVLAAALPDTLPADLLSTLQWRVLRTGMGANGLLMPCAALPSLIAWLEKKWNDTATEFFAIDDEIDSWSRGTQLVFRHNLISHPNSGPSEVWSDTSFRNRATPHCLETLFWFGNWWTLYHTYCDKSLFSPCDKTRPFLPAADGLRTPGHPRPRAS